ncbi:hypothetical protein GN244_ATG17287 [Phytophthora infestans]|uniref:Uncharacterized protein n=1 Tax=Phytophthora infestans TaxID=4787 RepID=A0A833S9A2_PHYIN|nr:hypothetical protein GN244_ATG17287 [Phytophthora infestans]
MDLPVLHVSRSSTKSEVSCTDHSISTTEQTGTVTAAGANGHYRRLHPSDVQHLGCDGQRRSTVLRLVRHHASSVNGYVDRGHKQSDNRHGHEKYSRQDRHVDDSRVRNVVNLRDRDIGHHGPDNYSSCHYVAGHHCPDNYSTRHYIAGHHCPGSDNCRSVNFFEHFGHYYVHDDEYWQDWFVHHNTGILRHVDQLGRVHHAAIGHAAVGTSPLTSPVSSLLNVGTFCHSLLRCNAQEPSRTSGSAHLRSISQCRNLCKSMFSLDHVLHTTPS